jgi:cation:H+ antiporter
LVISPVLLFLASLALSILSSLVLAETVDRLGSRLGVSEGLLGILTALGADAPEISAAVTAIQGGRASLGFGVVLGSNIFNLAALLGLSAVVAGHVHIHRVGLLWEGVVVMATTALVSALLLGLLSPPATVGLMAVALVPYVLVSSLRPAQAERLAASGGRPQALLLSVLADVTRDVRTGETAPRASRHDLLTLVPSLVCVVLASVGMVRASVVLGGRWGVPQFLVGTLVLASVTGIPNVIAAVRLALRRRGSAVVSESLNSNTINLLVGIALPALVLGVGQASSQTRLSVWWLLAMTLGGLLLTGRKGGLHRWEGLVVIGAYLAFVGLLVVR